MKQVKIGWKKTAREVTSGGPYPGMPHRGLGRGVGSGAGIRLVEDSYLNRYGHGSEFYGKGHFKGGGGETCGDT